MHSFQAFVRLKNHLLKPIKNPLKYYSKYKNTIFLFNELLLTCEKKITHSNVFKKVDIFINKTKINVSDISGPSNFRLQTVRHNRMVDVTFAPLRSLSDFLLESARFQMPNMKDPDKWANRVIHNLYYYQTNYFLTTLIIFLIIG